MNARYMDELKMTRNEREMSLNMDELRMPRNELRLELDQA